MATYTFSEKVESVDPNPESNFGGLVNDANHNAMTGVTGAGPQTTDISGSPVTSPATVSTGTTLTVPLNAAQVTLISNVGINISELAALTDYFTLPASTLLTIDVTRCSKLYLSSTAGNATVSFYFNVV